MKVKNEYMVTKRNDLIQQFTYDLNSLQWDLFDYVIANIKSPFKYDKDGKILAIKDKDGNVISTYDKEFNEVSFYIKDYYKTVYGINPGGKDIKNFFIMANDLGNKKTNPFIESKGKYKGYLTTLNLFERVYVNPENGHCVILLHDDLRESLLEIDNTKGNGRFTNYMLRYKIKLKSKFSKRLYEILKSNQNLKDGIYPPGIDGLPIDDFKKLLHIKDSYQYGTIKKRILEESINEINKNTDIFVSYKERKTSRKVTGITFIIKKQTVHKNYIDADAVIKEDIKQVKFVYRSLIEENLMKFFDITNKESYEDIAARVDENIMLKYELPEGMELGMYRDRYMQEILNNVKDKDINNKWKYLRKILENDFKEYSKNKRKESEPKEQISIEYIFNLCKDKDKYGIKEYKELDKEEKIIVDKLLALYKKSNQMTDEEIVGYINENNLKSIELNNVIGEERSEKLNNVTLKELEEMINQLKKGEL